ncbi:hypothetical protein [Priestia megaterium]|nr:hypothetical protein [Priestia megaterium]
MEEKNPNSGSNKNEDFWNQIKIKLPQDYKIPDPRIINTIRKFL